jgi:hypothetical protein
MPNSANDPQWVASRQAALKADKKPAPRSRQLAMFPRPERLTPEMARPDQFHRLPGVMWHGNYDPSSVSKPGLQNFHAQTGRYNPVGVHAGTKRAAMDALDWHGEYDSDKDPNYVPYNADDPRERKAANEAHGSHGYLHPVLPSRILPRRESASRQTGLWQDPGDDWTGPVALTNYRDIGKKQDQWSLRDDDVAADRPTFRYDSVKHGLRYQNDTEHPGSTSVLIPTSAPMQHSDYVREAIVNGRKVHPLTERLYNDGLLDQVEARKYQPMRNPAVTGVNATHSDTKRTARTARVKSTRKREFLQTGQEPLF